MNYGIDLGTTNSCVAGWDEDNSKPEFYQNVVTGSTVTPSVVYFDPDTPNTVLVGDEALASFQIRPDRTVRGIKRRIGDIDSYDPRTNGIPDGNDPISISALILKKLIADVARGHEKKVENVVITIPAHFGTLERENTKKAAEAIGLNVLELVHEPTAAALAYGLGETVDKNIIVYDLGGGTFDVSCVRILANPNAINTFRYIAIAGDAKLGGLDWDREIAQILLEKYNKEVGTSYSLRKEEELTNDSVEVRLTATLLESAEKIKKLLSTGRPHINSAISFDGTVLKVRVTQDEFNTRTRHLLDRTIEMTRSVIQKANNIDEIILVGGSTRMPQVSKALKDEFDITPKLYEPDFAVAKGAAIYANKIGQYIEDVDGVLRVDPTRPNTFNNILSKTYGLIVLGGSVVNIMFRGERLPMNKLIANTFAVAHEDQDSVRLALYESDLEQSRENYSIPDNEVGEKCRFIAHCDVKFNRKYKANTPISLRLQVNDEQLIDFEVKIDEEIQNSQIKLSIQDDPNRRSKLESVEVS